MTTGNTEVPMKHNESGKDYWLLGSRVWMTTTMKSRILYEFRGFDDHSQMYVFLRRGTTDSYLYANIESLTMGLLRPFLYNFTRLDPENPIECQDKPLRRPHATS